MMKQPEECSSIDDIRAEIDRIDRQVVALVGRRAAYVKAVARFKTDEADVRAAERFEAMLRQRRAWAEAEGLDPDMVEKLYRDMVNHFIQKEMTHWRETSIAGGQEPAVELAEASDLGEILNLQKLAFKGEAERYDDDTLPPLTQTLAGIQADFERMVLLKASIDDRIVGSVRAHMTGDTCFIGRLVVHPDLRNRGIGTQLMHAIERRFDEAQRFELFTGHRSDPALRLYRKLGYTEFKRKKLDTHTLVFLKKKNGGGT